MISFFKHWITIESTGKIQFRPGLEYSYVQELISFCIRFDSIFFSFTDLRSSYLILTESPDSGHINVERGHFWYSEDGIL